MRTPNCECVICGKPLYRRPFELKKVRHVACMEHRGEAQAKSGITEKQKAALSLGKRKGGKSRIGYKHDEKTKRKISESHKDYWKDNPEKAKERGKQNRGANHYKWSGGSSRINVSIRTLTENRKWMDAVKARDGKCLVCGSTNELESHHIIPLAELISANGIKNREDARKCDSLWDLDNGMTVCRKCHYQIHGRSYED